MASLGHHGGHGACPEHLQQGQVSHHQIYHEDNTDYLPQLSGAAVRPGLQQGVLSAPVSLGQDAGAVWGEARGLPARLPVRQAGNTGI